MGTRVEWADIANAARECAAELGGKEWVRATFRASTLLDDLADEHERLAAENVRLKSAAAALARKPAKPDGPAVWMVEVLIGLEILTVLVIMVAELFIQ